MKPKTTPPFVLALALGAAVLAPHAGAQSATESGAAASGDDRRLETVIVTSRAQELYRVRETTTGKLPTEPLLSSQSITVLNSELIDDQGARDAKDLYRNISGVTVFSYAGITARGFRQEANFFDGLRGDPYAGFSVPQLFNVERVEFLKGPAGMLYGAGAPGGLFNYVTKTPQDEFSATASAVYGTEGRKGAAYEVTGRLPASGAAGRLGIFYEDQNGPRKNAGSEISIVDAGVKFDIGFADLSLKATRYDQSLQGNRLRGVITDNAGNFLADRRWNHNEASDFLDLESNVVQATLTGEAFEGLTWDAGLRYNDGTETQQYHEPSGLFDTDADGVIDSTRRQFRDQYRRNESVTFGANAIWSQSLGPVDNRLLAGADWYKLDAFLSSVLVNGTNIAGTGRPSPLSLINPVYGATDPASYVRPAANLTDSQQTRYGYYALGEATFGPLIGIAGVRQDTFEDVNSITGQSFEDSAATLRAGLVYRVRDDISLFGQWSESYEPQSIGSQNPLAGGPFEPTEGEIYEGGIKTELMGGRVQSSASVYQIVRTNILQADPRGDVSGDGVNDQIAFAEITSEGFEADITADITDNWVGTVSYAYNDTVISKTNGQTAITNSVGDKFANAPEHEVGFWTRYQIPAWNTAFALGGDYVDVRRSLSGQKVRPYVIFDASIIYESGNWKALLRIDNLFDETYASSGFSATTGHFPGDPRSMFIEISRNW